MDPTVLYTMVERLGMPMAFLVLIGYAFWRILRAVWEFVKPLVGKAFDKHFALIDTVTAKFEAVSEIQIVADKCLTGHDTTHKKIDEVRQDFRDLRNRIRPSSEPPKP